MESKTQWRILLGIVFVALIVVPLASLINIPADNALDFIIRITALWGLVGLSLSALMNINKRVLYQKFGLKFMKLHHAMAIFAFLFATLHPVVFAFKVGSAAIFIPNFSSWYLFWLLGGRPALIVMYIALAAVLLRKRTKKAWKWLHRLIYVALILIIVHGILIGTDFKSPLILVFFVILTGAALFTGIYLRFKNPKRKKNKTAA